MDLKNTKPPAKVIVVFALFCLAVLGIPKISAQNTDPTRDSVIVGTIELTGNKKTLEFIILRELQFTPGDTIPMKYIGSLVEQSRLNLLNTALFNFVTIDTVFVSLPEATDLISIKINVLERWYVWPVPILQITDRNFNSWWQSRDFTRINYGLDVKWHNFTGRLDELDANIQYGKNHQLSLAYHNPYIDRHKHFGMGFELGYRKNRETGYITANDKLKFAFVSEGLFTEKYIVVNSSWRNSIFTTHELAAGLHSFSFSDSLLALNPDYSYSEIDEPVFLSIYYKLKIDHRDIKYYPLKGWYADVEVNKLGFGFNFEKPVDVAWVKTTTRFYSQLANRWYSGVSFIGKMSSGAWQPYFIIQGLGYSRDYIRGYQYNVIDGKHFGIVRSNVKFALLPEQIRNIKFISTPKFSRIHYALYLSVFADAGYVWQPQWIGQYNNVLPQTFLAGAGLGADLVTYYDKVVRIEYTVNKSGKSGIFIHFIAGI